MKREDFPKIKKGDVVTDGTKVYCVLKLQNKPEFNSHGRHVGWINGFQYLDTDGFIKFQEYNSKDFKIIGHSEAFSAFLKAFRKELKAFSIS